MRITVSFFLASIMLALSTSAQQLAIDPGAGEFLTLVKTEAMPGGDLVSVGTIVRPPLYVEEAIVICKDPAGTFVWGKTFNIGTSFKNVVVDAASGDVICVGNSLSDAFAVRLSSGGGFIWAKAYVTGVPEVFTSVAIGPDGFVYPSGTSTISGTTRAVALKLDALGNPLWAKEQPWASTSNSVTKSLVRFDSLFLFGSETTPGARDVSLRILHTQSSLELFHRTYGDNTTGDWAADVAQMPSGLLVATTQSAGLSSRMGLFKLDGGLNLSGNSKTYLVPGSQVAGAQLCVSGGDAYMSSQVANGSDTYSHLLKIDAASLDTLWSKTLVSSSFPMKPAVQGGLVRMMSTKSDTPPQPILRGILTSVDAASGSVAGPACEVPSQQVFIKQNYPNLVQQTYAPVAWNSPWFTAVPVTTVSDYVAMIVPCGATSLPVELVSFDAKVEGSSVLISWQTASEHNNDFFTIERSTDGGSVFEPISSHDGAGDSQTSIMYHTMDMWPEPGTNIYRLRQTDFDGTTSLSAVVAVDFKDGAMLLAYPNPASAGSPIRFPGAFQVFDMSGRCVAKATDEVSGLPSGVYDFRSDSGRTRVVVN